MEAQGQEFLRQIASNTGSKVCLGEEELTLNGTTAQNLPFTSIKKTDVYSVEIRVRRAGSPTDSAYIATFTQSAGGVPSSTHGQYLGNGDFYEISGQANAINFNIIATEALSHVCHIVYYGV